MVEEIKLNRLEIEKIKFDEKGLVPAIVQDFYTKEILTLAYMNKESLEISISEGRTCFWSRSRQELWRKGETSGNTQRIVSIHSDCDRDALIVEVIKNGPACHLGTDSCFTNEIYFGKDSIYGEESKTINEKIGIDELYNLLIERDLKRPKDSYTTYLFEKGKEKILKKIGEEATEVVIGAMKDDNKETIYEISDLCYHTLVLMVSMGITVEDIKNELSSRHIIDKKNKQETMK